MPGESEDREEIGENRQWRRDMERWRSDMDGPDGWTKGMDKRIRALENRIWYMGGAAMVFGLSIPYLIDLFTTGAKHVP